MIRTRAQTQHQVWPNPVLTELPQNFPQELLVVGLEIDVLDHTGVWCDGRIDKMEHNCLIIHYQGWQAVEHDEVIYLPQGAYRLAHRYTYTRCAKCAVELHSDGGKHWPSVVHFRMPDPFQRVPIPQVPPVPTLAHVVLRAATYLFVVPYLPHLLPPGSLKWWNEIGLDGGMWVHKRLVHPWSEDSQKHRSALDPDLRGSMDRAHQADSRDGIVLTTDVFQAGVLLKDEYLVKTSRLLANPAWEIDSSIASNDDGSYSYDNEEERSLRSQDGDEIMSSSASNDGAPNSNDKEEEQNLRSHNGDEMSLSSSPNKNERESSTNLTELPPVNLNDWDGESSDASNLDEADDWMSGAIEGTPNMPSVGTQVDLLDLDQVWTHGQVSEVSVEAAVFSAGPVKVHFHGFSKLMDCNLEWPKEAPRIADVGSHTKQLKGCFCLASEQCNGMQISVVWPCKVLFRVPVQPETNKTLRTAQRLFVKPYMLSDLQSLFCGGNWIDDGIWVDLDCLRPWGHTSKSGCDALAVKAFEAAEQDSCVPPMMTCDIFVAGTLLKEVDLQEDCEDDGQHDGHDYGQNDGQGDDLNVFNQDITVFDRPRSGPIRRVSSGSQTLPGSPSTDFRPASPLTGMKLLAEATLAMYAH